MTAYKDVAAEVACLLSGTPSLDLFAVERLVLYRQRGRGGPKRARFRRELRDRRVRAWQTCFDDGRKRFGGEIVVALGPRIGDLVRRVYGNLTYRLTQVLMDHGVFGSYLARIDREETTECWFCGAPEDDVEHTVAEFPSWDEHRHWLVGVIGPDLSIHNLVDALLRGPREWSAISRFSEVVLRAKEDREQEREKSGVRRRMLRASRVKIRIIREKEISLMRKERKKRKRRRMKEWFQTFVIGRGRGNVIVVGEEEENEDENADDNGVFD